MMSHPRFLLAATVVLAACADAPSTAPRTMGDALAAPGLAVSAASLPAVMTNLDNPRGLAWDPERALYVAEAGDLQVRGACVTVVRGPNC